MPKTTKVHISIETHVCLDVSEIWPDGDAPDEITEESVAAEMRRSLGAHSNPLRDGIDAWRLGEQWCLSSDATMTIHVDSGDAVKKLP